MSKIGNSTHIRFFTLIEILVAVAVLVIMMGFLFQFVAGAQRIWGVSSSRSIQARRARTVLNFLQEDFNSIKAGETVGRGYYFIRHEIDSDNSELILIRKKNSSMQVVKYTLKDNNLYREVVIENFPENCCRLIKCDVKVYQDPEDESKTVNYDYVFSFDGVYKYGINGKTVYEFTPNGYTEENGYPCYSSEKVSSSGTSEWNVVISTYFGAFDGVVGDVLKTPVEDNILADDIKTVKYTCTTENKKEMEYIPVPGLMYFLIETSSPAQFGGFVKSDNDNDMTFTKLFFIRK